MSAAKPSTALLRRGHPLALGLVGLWPLCEGSGPNIYDLSGNDATGTGVASPPWAGTPLGWGVTLDGASQYWTLPNLPALNITSDISLFAWARTTNAGQMTLIGGYQATSPFLGYALAMGVDAVGQLEYWDGVSWHDGPSSLNDGLWHLFGVTVTAPGAGNVTFYVDGHAAGTIGGQRPSSFAGARALGARADGGNIWNGSVAYFGIWSRALSQQDVALLYADSWQVLRRRSWLLKGAVAAGLSPHPLVVGQAVPGAVSL